MTEIRIGYARCSTNHQDLTAQQEALISLGVSPDRIYTDKGLTGANRQRPGLDQALAAVRRGDTLVVPKLDRLARSVPDAREIADALQTRGVKLALGASLYDPEDPVGKMFFNVLATFAEFEGDLIRLRTREGMAIARAKGKLRGNSQSFQTSSKKSFVECMDVVSIQSVIWLNYFQSPDLLFIEHLREDKNERSEPKRLPFRKLEKTI
jgi:DNA invertase Pin-like site-specific DNA recombinase